MRLTEIDIERFRIWRNLMLRLNPTGLNVIFGPNEAGKTTLMSFVRSVLYGFDPMDEEPSWHRSAKEPPWGGLIRCEHAGNDYRLERVAECEGRGQLLVSSDTTAGEGAPTSDQDEDEESGVSFLMSGITEAIYSDVFAVGVRELHQLATLETDQVSEHIYGISLGPQGRQILNALGDVKDRATELFGDGCTTGRLPGLFEHYSSLSGHRRDGGVERARHATLVRRRLELNDDIDSLQSRESAVRNELRGMRFLQSCHNPWKRSRDLRDELGRLPVVLGDPEEALQLIAACEKDIQECRARNDKLTAQAEQLNQQAQRVPIDEQFGQQRFAIQTLTDQSDWLRQLDSSISEAEEHASELKRDLNRNIADLGEDWSLDRLNSIDMSSAAHHRLLQSARQYQAALQRRGKLNRWNRGLSKRSQQELVDLNADLDPLGMSVEEAIAAEQHRMQELENLSRLRLQEEQLALKIQTVRRVMSRVETEESIPVWVDKAVNAMWWIGTALFLFGIMTFALGGDAQRSLGGALAAAAFGFAGMMWWGVRNGLRNHFDRKTGIQLDDLTEESRQADRQLRSIQQRIQDMSIAIDRPVDSQDDQTTTAELVQQIGTCSRRIADLQSLARREARAASRRDRLRTLRERFRTARAALVEQRTAWCDVLRGIGLNETVKVEQAFDWWQRIQEVRELHTEWRNAAPEVEGLRRMFNGMQIRIEQLGLQLTCAADMDFSRPLEVLTAWQQQLTTHDRDKAEFERLTQECGDRQRDAIHMQHQLESAEMRRTAILTRSGAVSTDEVEQQLNCVNKRSQLESLKQQADEELNEVVAADPELAIVEEDLVRFDVLSAKERIMLLDLELADIESALSTNHEELGSLKQELKLLETSRGTHDDFFQRAKLSTEIYRAAESWFGLQIEHDALQQMRQRFEQENISGTLVTASLYMHRMTSGRYHRIWAPLGEDFLCIDDEYGQTFRVGQLSGGTREQLFLSIRFALVREFARRGIELPVIMDDLFVNFDQERTDAAIDCLIELAAEGQQVLFFTCHEHLAKLFQQKNVEPLWLPGHKVALDLHKPELEIAGQTARVDGAGTTARGPTAAATHFVIDSDELLNDSEDQPNGRRLRESG
jgi:uncharacterized protein YhaN